MEKSVHVDVKIDTAKLEDAERKVLELSEYIKRAKSLADELAHGLDIELEIV